MTDPAVPNRDAFLDALAFTRCTWGQDWQGRHAVAMSCDPVQMVEALTYLYLGFIRHLTGEPGVEPYLAYLQDHLGDVIGTGE